MHTEIAVPVLGGGRGDSGCVLLGEDGGERCVRDEYVRMKLGCMQQEHSK